jgi:hypothetical protein
MLHQLSDCLVVIIQVLNLLVPIIIQRFKPPVAGLQPPDMIKPAADPLDQAMSSALPQSPESGGLRVCSQGDSRHCCEPASSSCSSRWYGLARPRKEWSHAFGKLQGLQRKQLEQNEAQRV